MISSSEQDGPSMDDNLDDFDDLLAEFDDDPFLAGVRQDVKERQALVRFLRDTRKKLNPKVNQTQIGEVIGLSQATISAFEGTEADPQISRYQRYARALGLRARIVLTQVWDDGGERIVWSESPELCVENTTDGFYHVTRAVLVNSSGAGKQVGGTADFVPTGDGSFALRGVVRKPELETGGEETTVSNDVTVNA